MPAFDGFELYKRYQYLFTDEEFLAIKSSKGRIERILTKCWPRNVLRPEMQNIISRYIEDHVKSVTKSKKYRVEAKQWFEKKNYQTALDMCHKAILSAPFPTATDNFGNALGLSFAYQTVVEIQMKNYLNALFAANKSLEFFETIEILKRKVHCLSRLKRYEESIKLLDQLIDRSMNDRTLDFKGTTAEDLKGIRNTIVEKMSEDSGHQVSTKVEETDNNEKSPDGHFWIHPTCELNSSPNKGRFMVAGQPVPKGTPILIEKPMCWVINITEQINFCNNCRKALKNKIWPCHGCDELAFCDEKCYREAYDKFHRFECGFVNYLHQGIGNKFLHAFRLITRYGVRQAIDWESNKELPDLKQYISSGLSSEEVPDFNTLYRAFTSLVDNSSHCDDHTFINMGFKSIQTAFLLEKASQTELSLPSLLTLADLCFRTIRRSDINVFGQSVFEPKRKSVAGCITIVGSLFNHSCDPNVYWTFKSSGLLAKADRDIDAGEELCITYGPTIRSKEFIERQVDLKSKYCFTCSCKACLTSSRSVLALRCHQCSGPVIFNLPLPLHIKDKKAYCLECGTKFKKLKIFSIRVKALTRLFDNSMTDVDNKFNIQEALNIADQSLQELLNLVYARSSPLLQDVVKFIGKLRDYNRLEEAIEYGRVIERSIKLEMKDSENISDSPVMVFEYFLFITDCYYKYLKRNQILDQSVWDQCFLFYEQLFQHLEQNKRKESEEDEDEESKERVQLFGDVLELKKEELKELQKRRPV